MSWASFIKKNAALLSVCCWPNCAFFLSRSTREWAPYLSHHGNSSFGALLFSGGAARRKVPREETKLGERRQKTSISFSAPLSASLPPPFM